MLKKDDPTKQLVYYQVISLRPTLMVRVQFRAHIPFPRPESAHTRAT